VATTLAMWLFLFRSAMAMGFVELAVLEGSGNLLDEDTRLFASRAIHEGAVNHDAEGVNREDKEDEDNDQRERAHVLEHVAQIEAGCASFLQQNCKGEKSSYHSLLLKFQVTSRPSRAINESCLLNTANSEWRACPTTGTPARTKLS